MTIELAEVKNESTLTSANVSAPRSEGVRRHFSASHIMRQAKMMSRLYCLSRVE